MQPVAALQPAASPLAGNPDILPVAGGAVEDLLQPYLGEFHHRLFNAGSRELAEFLETPVPNLHHLYLPAPPTFLLQRHHYHYHTEGGLRDYCPAGGIARNRMHKLEIATIEQLDFSGTAPVPEKVILPRPKCHRERMVQS
jgi:hypothetical protein